jgi:hypothetical protein
MLSDSFIMETSFCEADYDNDPEESCWIPSHFVGGIGAGQVNESKGRNSAADICPKIDDWDEVETLSSPVVTIDKARREVWKQGQQEIHAIRSKLKARMEQESSMDTGNKRDVAVFLFQVVFGPLSSIGSFFQTSLNIDAKVYCSFMTSFFSSCQWGAALSHLHNSTRIDGTGLMKLDEYNILWRKIAKIGSNKSNNQSVQPFWMGVGDVLNKELMTLFLPEDMDEFNFLVALDDDKMHYNIGSSTECMGLKEQRHVKANRTGFTAHTSAYAAVDVPIRIDMERENDNPQTCYERQMRALFGRGRGGLMPDLSNVTVASDRGYWQASLLFSFLLYCGANIIGTVKRNNWFPFTFDRKDEPGKAKNINCKGAKCVYYKKLKMKKVVSSAGAHREILAVAYRNGSGNNVSLAMSSLHRANWWDLSLANQSDSKWYFQDTTQFERSARCFESFRGSEDDKAEQIEAILENVETRTVSQLGTDWFLDRMFSMTSSTVDGAIRAAAPSVKPGDPIYDDFKKVLEYAGLENMLATEAAVENLEPEELQEEAEELQEQEPQQPQPQPDEPQHAEEAATTIPAVGTEENPPVDPASVFIQNADSSNIDNRDVLIVEAKAMSLQQVQAVLAKLNAPTTGSISKLKKDLEKWIKSEPASRPYSFMSRAQLHDQVKLRRLRSIANAKKDDLLRCLIEADSAPAPTIGQQGSTVEDSRYVSEDGLSVDPVLLAILKASYLKKQASTARSFTRKGQKMEQPLLGKLWDDSQKEGAQRLPKFASLFRPGLVANKAKPFVKDSADCIGVVDGSLEVLPIEVKARVATNTAVKEKLALQDNIGLEEYSVFERPYIKISSEDVKKWIPSDHESFQLLHHVFCYGAKRGLLLVGDNKKILCGFVVDFQEDLLRSWEKVVLFLYERGLKWAYESPFPEDLISKAVEVDQLATLKLDLHSVKTTLGLWRAFNVEPASHIKFPLPKCDKIIPYPHSFWNTVKGGSDTITKLIDTVEEQLGVRTPSSCTSARLMLLFVVAYQRALQVMTSKEDLEAYGTLYHFRHAASRRFPVFKVLDLIGDMFQEQSGKQAILALKGNEDVIFQDESSLNPTTPVMRRSRRQGAVDIQSKENWIPQVAHAITPGKGNKKGNAKPTTKSIAHSLRCEECIGLVPVARIEEPSKRGKVGPIRRRCDICKTQTNMFCLGCKRFLCMDKDRTDKMEEEGRAGALKFRQTKRDHITGKETHETFFATKSCYHFAHEHILDKIQGLRAEEPSYLTQTIDPEAAKAQKKLLELKRVVVSFAD